MEKIAIITDTSQDFSKEMAEKYGVRLASYYIQMGERHLKDQVDIVSREFFKIMHEYSTLSSGIPPIQEVLDIVDQIKEEGYTDIILLTSSSKITGMRSLYKTLESMVEGIRLHPFDTGQIGASSALMTIYASELRDKGLSCEEILSELERVKPKAKILALFRTLKYLVQGGRFSKYKGILGMFLKINPLLGDVNGEVGVIDKFRGKKNSLNGLIDYTRKYLKGAKKYKLAIFSGDDDAEILELKDRIKDLIEGAEHFIETEFTPVLGVHAGPESIGIAYLILD